MGILQKDNFVDDGNYNYRPYTDALKEYPTHDITDFEFVPITLKSSHENNTIVNPGDMWFSTSATTIGQVSYFIGSDDPGPLYKKDHSEYTKEKTELDSIIAHYYGRSLLI